MNFNEKLQLFAPPIVRALYIKNVKELCPANDYAEWFLDREESTFTGGFSFSKSPEGVEFWIEARNNFIKLENLYNH